MSVNKPSKGKVVEVEVIRPELEERLGAVVKYCGDSERVFVNKIDYGRPAHGNLFIGDIILALNGRRIKHVGDLMEAQKTKAETDIFRVYRHAEEEVGEPGKFVDVKLNREGADELFGVTVGYSVETKTMAVLEVEEGTAADGNIFAGDLIQGLNGVKLKDIDHLMETLKTKAVKDVFQVHRVKFSRFLGTDNEQLISREAGVDYYLLQINVANEKSRNPGMFTVKWNNKLMVGWVRRGGFAEDYFKILDQILIVNGVPISEIEEFNFLVRYCGGKLEIVIGRPRSAELKAQYQRALETKSERKAREEKEKLTRQGTSWF